MSLFITSLNSGSNGNCYYIGNKQEAVLVDVGISCKEVEMRMNRLGLSMQKIKAIFISHEHTDHIRGVSSLSKKFQLPVYITAGARLHGRLKLQKELMISFCDKLPISIGELTIHAFQKHHDASDPYSFTICSNGISVGVFTDIGTPCKNLIHHFKQCHAAFLEANYDEDMLTNGSYPYFLKQRIRGGKGHLSNTQALDLFNTHRPSYMSHLVLSHLSKNNNCPKLVGDLFNAHAKGVQVVVASRYEESPVYQISPAGFTAILPLVKKVAAPQLSFAFG